jgi:hypothetical protein
MTSKYDHHGIRFQYPENWTLDDSEEGDFSLTVYSPEGSFWSVMWRELTVDPHDLAIEALQALKKEYAETESEPVNEELAGFEVAGFDINFYYVDLSNTALIRYFRTPTASCVVLCQAEDHDFPKTEAVFQAMTLSLLKSA